MFSKGLVTFLLITAVVVVHKVNAGNACKDLGKAAQDLYDLQNKDGPKAFFKYKTSVVNMIVDSCKNDYDQYDREFPFDLMDEITTTNLNFDDRKTLGTTKDTWLKYITYSDKEVHGDGAKKEGSFDQSLKDVLDKHTFSIRHYTPTGYDTIASSFYLLSSKTITMKQSHTTIADWKDLGNIAFTFWVFAIDGTPPSGRGFLSNCKYYQEIEFTPKGEKKAVPDGKSLEEHKLDDSDFFASVDLMPCYKDCYKQGTKAPLLKGKLRDLPQLVLGHLLKTGKSLEELKKMNTAGLLSAIDTGFTFNGESKFEVKVPGTVKVDKSKWVKIE